MYLSSALVAASAFALHTSAFLLPLEVSKAAEQARYPLTSGPNRLELDCPGCPFFGIEDTAEVQPDVENKIVSTCLSNLSPLHANHLLPQLLDFGIDAKDSLTINNHTLPTPYADTPGSYHLTAPQTRIQDGQKTLPIQLDFAWEELPPVTSERNPKLSMQSYQLTILGLAGHPIKVDTVAVHVLRAPGQTMIARISTIPFNETPGATTCDTSSKWSICRLRAIVAARMQAMVAAAKGRAQAAKGWFKGHGNGKGCSGKFGHRGGHNGGHNGGPPFMHHEHGQAAQGGHHHHHQHRHGHHLGRLLHQTLRFFVIPALLGVIGGLMASAIGMLVGQFVAFLWIRYHRGGRRGNVRTVELVIEEDEKDALIIDDEITLPQYEDVEAAVVEDEKK